MNLPDFVIIGAAKAGTTSLYALLDRHPDVFMPTPKEPEFFARDDHYAKGIAQYSELFASAEPHQVVGEASTLYSLAPFFDQTAARLHAHIPKAKLIYVLREPVSRAYSFYVQLIKNYQNVTGDRTVHRTFEEFIDPLARNDAAPRSKVLSHANDHMPDDPELCLAGSDYQQQIEAYLAYFPPEQILFLAFDDFVINPAETVRQITDFIGVDPLPDDEFAVKSNTRNVSKDHFDAMGTDIAASKMGEKAGIFWALRKLVPQFLRNHLKRMVLGGGATPDASHVPPPMLDETRAALKARFSKNRAAVEALSGLDLSRWG